MKVTTIPSTVPAEHPRCVAINDAIEMSVELTHAKAVALNRAYDEFWKGTLQDVVDFFNLLGVAQVTASGVEHNAEALRTNASLNAAVSNRPDLAAKYTTRAIDVARYLVEPEGMTVPGAALRLTAAGVFEVIPPQEP
ncbi:MAG: hypothetical protein V4733_03755 [Verrucomicrobiota bacterium]